MLVICSFTATDAEIRTLFAEHGTVRNCLLPTDREDGSAPRIRLRRNESSRCFARDSEPERQADLGGRALRVNEAQDKPRSGGGGGGMRNGAGRY